MKNNELNCDRPFNFLLKATNRGLAIKSISLIFIFMLSSSCYVSRQVWHHGHLLISRQKISEVIENTEIDPTTRTKLLKAREIVEFARQIGLYVDNSYEYFIETHTPVVSYLVQAAFADRLEFRTWWFPFVGRVPYLGFYDQSERDELAKDLELEGYDVKRGAAGAFSSLGWFQDPLFSSMLRRTESSLAHLLFHELTHRTIWIQNSPEFNENFAEFVAYILTRDYLIQNQQTDALSLYEQHIRDKEKFRLWLLALKNDLITLYSKKLPPNKLHPEKKRIFQNYQLQPKKPLFERIDYVGDADQPWNNASVLASSLYTPDVERFAKSFKCFQNVPQKIGAFITALKLEVQIEPDPDKALLKLCKRSL